MRRSWKALIVAAAVLLGTVGVMSLAAASQGQDTTLTLTTKTIQHTYLDHHPHGFSQGDEIIFADQLFLGGKMVGLDGVVCTVVHAAGPTPGPESHAQCVATFDLPKGQLTGQGMLALVEMQRHAPFAITGGTGAYRDAGGQGTVTDTSPNTARIVLHIENLK
jgi:hypothetical protein